MPDSLAHNSIVPDVSGISRRDFLRALGVGCATVALSPNIAFAVAPVVAAVGYAAAGLLAVYGLGVSYTSYSATRYSSVYDHWANGWLTLAEGIAAVEEFVNGFVDAAADVAVDITKSNIDWTGQALSDFTELLTNAGTSGKISASSLAALNADGTLNSNFFLLMSFCDFCSSQGTAAAALQNAPFAYVSPDNVLSNAINKTIYVPYTNTQTPLESRVAGLPFNARFPSSVLPMRVQDDIFDNSNAVAIRLICSNVSYDNAIKGIGNHIIVVCELSTDYVYRYNYTGVVSKDFENYQVGKFVSAYLCSDSWNINQPLSFTALSNLCFSPTTSNFFYGVGFLLDVGKSIIQHWTNTGLVTDFEITASRRAYNHMDISCSSGLYWRDNLTDNPDVLPNLHPWDDVAPDVIGGSAGATAGASPVGGGLVLNPDGSIPYYGDINVPYAGGDSWTSVGSWGDALARSGAGVVPRAYEQVRASDSAYAADSAGDVVLEPINSFPNADVPIITYPTKSVDFSPLTDSIADKFPFCLPKDLHTILSSFAAPAVAPNFELPVPAYFDEVGFVTGSETFSVDLSTFDEVARIFRLLTDALSIFAGVWLVRVFNEVKNGLKGGD